MMPAIINSFVFSEQTGLVLRTAPLQNQFPGSLEVLDDTANRFCLQVGTSNLPRRAGSSLFALQHSRFYQSRYRMVTDAT